MLKNKKVYIAVIVVFCILCAAGTIKTMLLNPSNHEYKENISIAQDYAKKELYYKSVYYYDLALKEKESEKVMLEELDAVMKGIDTGEFGEDDYETYLNKYMKTYYKSESPYNIALDHYYKNKNYDKCIKVIENAQSYGVENRKISEYKNSLSKKYKLVYTNYSSVTPFRNYLGAVNLDEKYGLTDSAGNIYAQCAYNYFSPCFYASEAEGESRLWSFAKDEKRTYLLNTNLVRQAYLPNEIESSTGVGDELLSCKIGDKYKYYNIDGKVMFNSKEYTYASKFVTNIAAVNNSGSWSVIDTNGKPLTNQTYYDIKINAFDECVKNKYVFIKGNLGDKYFAYKFEDNKLTKTDFSFDDIDLPPNAGEYIAFKNNEKWGFLNKNLEVVIEPEYDDARSFSSGYAGVCSDGKWYIINTENKSVIDVEDNITDISYASAYEDPSGKSHAYVYVKIDGAWQLMSLYIL